MGAELELLEEDNDDLEDDEDDMLLKLEDILEELTLWAKAGGIAARLREPAITAANSFFISKGGKRVECRCTLERRLVDGRLRFALTRTDDVFGLPIGGCLVGSSARRAQFIYHKCHSFFHRSDDVFVVPLQIRECQHLAAIGHRGVKARLRRGARGKSVVSVVAHERCG